MLVRYDNLVEKQKGVDRMGQLKWVLIAVVALTIGSANVSIVNQSAHFVHSTAQTVIGRARSYRRLLKKQITKVESEQIQEETQSDVIKKKASVRIESFNIEVFDAKTGNTVFTESVNADSNFADNGIAYNHLNTGNYSYLISQDGYIVNAGAFEVK